MYIKYSKKDNTVPLWLELKNKLCSELMSEKFNDKDQFHTIKETCELYKVSEITARRAISELVREKRLEKFWGKGCFVIKKSAPTKIILPMPSHHSLHSMQLLSIIYFELYRGIFQGLEKFNCELIPVSFDYIHTSDEPGQFILQAGTLYSSKEEEELYRWVKEKKHVCVICHALKPEEHISTIRADLRKGAHEATTHLVKQGYKRIALISTDINSMHHAPRFDGYYNALKKSGVNLDLRLVKVVDHKNPSTINAAMKELMALGENKPDAVFSSSSFHMTPILGFCKENGIRIPDDLGVLSFDNTSELATNNPPITVVDLLWRKDASLAVELLSELSKEADPQARDILLKPELVIRESTIRQ